MKNIFKYLMLAMVAVFGISLTSCNDNETDLSRKVLASVSVLEYDGEDPGVEIITVTSDGDWYVEAPEWITVTPSKGSVGQTEVEISVAPNYRDGSLDNPRKVTILFKGRNLESIASVIVRQGGDKFRDPIDYTIDEMEATEDETVVRLPDMIVTAVGPEGFICTDGDQYAFITEPAIAVEVGKKVSIVGEKWTNSMKFAYVKGERMTDEGTAPVPEKTPVDITETLDKTTGKKYQYVTVTGDFDGTAVKVEGNNCMAYPINANLDLGLNNLAGHKVTLTGFFAGQASPVVNIIPTEVVDLGLNEIVLFVEDFEWISPWAIAGKDGNTPAGDTVNTNGKTTEAPKADACKVDGVTLTEELMKRGYDFVSAHDYNNADGNRDFALYVQQNYLKFNKTGNVNGAPYQEGLILPALKEAPESGLPITISFDWCPQMQGDGMYDKTEMAVIIDNGNDVVEKVAPAHNRADSSPYSWQKATLDLSDVKLDTKTKITIRNSDAAFKDKTAHRFYLDNIKISYIP